jgi:hypothetical protein
MRFDGDVPRDQVYLQRFIRGSGSRPSHDIGFYLRTAARVIGSKPLPRELRRSYLAPTLRDRYAEIAIAELTIERIELLASTEAFQGVSSSSYGTLTATALVAAAKRTRGQTEVPCRKLRP